MAEQEVIKHTKKVIQTVGDNEKGWKHKLKEIILEVLIIVFAVTLSISLHNWSEKRHDRHEEHAFLEGLRNDLKNDIVEMQDDSIAYQRVVKGTAYFAKVAYGEPLNKDSLAKYEAMFFNATYLAPNISRFEGLKASGKINIIQNKELLTNILDLYQENIPLVNLQNEWFNTYKRSYLGPIIDRQLVIAKDGSTNWETILRSNELRNGLRRTVDADDIVKIYGYCIKKAKVIIALIDKELK